MDELRTFSIPQVAKLLGISRSEAYELAHQGVIQVVPLGPRLHVVPYLSLKKLLESAGPMQAKREAKRPLRVIGGRERK